MPGIRPAIYIFTKVGSYYMSYLKRFSIFALVYASFSSSLQANPELTFKATAQMAYAEATEDMYSYFHPGEGFRVDLFGGVKLPMVSFLNAAGLGLDFTYLEFKGKNSTGDLYRSYQWDWFGLPLPGLSMGLLSVNLDIGMFWNVIDVNINEFQYSQTSIRPGVSALFGLALNLGPYFAFVFDARYNTMFEDSERLSVDTVKKISMNYPVFYAGIRARI